jgi:hypothetical protein
VKYTSPSGGGTKTIRCLKRAEDEELLEMDAFFEDVYEGDQDIIRKNRLKKEEAGEEDDGGGDTKF